MRIWPSSRLAAVPRPSPEPIATLAAPRSQAARSLSARSEALAAGSAVSNLASLIVNANATAGHVSGTGTTTVAGGVTLNASSFAQGGLAMQLCARRLSPTPS